MKTLIASRSHLQNKNIIKYFTDSDIKVLDRPFISIEPLTDHNNFEIINQINKYDKLIFISSNAAACFKQLLNIHKVSLTNEQQVFCIGPTTKNELVSFLTQKIKYPENNFDSESLLNHPELIHPNSQKILIIRGQGGREVLKDTLESKGASVEYLECYRRLLMPINFNEIKSHAESSKTFILITSTEVAKHYLSLFNRNNEKFEAAYIVNHKKIMDLLEPLKNKILLTKTLDPRNISLLIQNFT